MIRWNAINLNSEEKIKQCINLKEQGNEQEVDNVEISIFDELIRRDNDEILINSIYDVMTVAAYYAARAEQMEECVEFEMRKLDENVAKNFDQMFSLLCQVAKKLLNVELKSDLKPCPFCGGRADCSDNEYGDDTVECQKCGASVYASGEGKDGARERWNCRYDESENKTQGILILE